MCWINEREISLSGYKFQFGAGGQAWCCANQFVDLFLEFVLIDEAVDLDGAAYRSNSFQSFSVRSKRDAIGTGEDRRELLPTNSVLPAQSSLQIFKKIL